eukprot:TRINITY_DN20234_c0_g1_i1.p1 TRINITY_DN20234_c0_g1~~TRINITY_DN20234_c0_g1_i1.p1  ORF type:complete len:390 (+),score=62.16 TRINITY_DN20234_c0_g1_i1:176-1345(+)
MMMTSFDGEQIFYSDQNLATEVEMGDSRYEVLKKCKIFLREWRNAEGQYIYRDALFKNGSAGRYFIAVDLSDLDSFDQKLATLFRSRPMEYHPMMELAAREVFDTFTLRAEDEPLIRPSEFQVQLFSAENPRPLRELKSHLLGTLVTVEGIIISATKVATKAKTIRIECSNCLNTKTLPVPFGIGGVPIPRLCDKVFEAGPGRERCPLDPYVIVPDSCEFYDQQILKIQESPEAMPSGEIPRSFQVCLDRYLVDRLTPGTRATITGVYTVLERRLLKAADVTSASLKLPYVYALGYMVQRTGARKFEATFTVEEEEKFRIMGRDPRIYQQVSRSIASAIYGHEDIKKAICCLLFGGSRKVLPDRMKLRGDINILPVSYTHLTLPTIYSV